MTTMALPPVIEKCKTCGLPIGRCKYKGNHPSKQKSSKPKQETTKPKKNSSNRSTQSNSSTGMSQAQRDRVLHELEDNMVWVEGGTFTMGVSPDDERYSSWYWDGCKPAHQVTLTAFYICKYEVTQELWQAVMGTTLSQQRDKYSKSYKFELYGVGDNYPMHYLSWKDCQKFIERLNRITGKRYRLPTEAEWEYAACGGNRSQGYEYSGGNDLSAVAWYAGNSGDSTHPVGQKSPNELGLYDMNGNVEEWCQDWYGSYISGSQTNPTGPSTGSDRVIRGSSFYNDAVAFRVSHRYCLVPSAFNWTTGLRLAL